MPPANDLPLIVDLDGTLLCSDLLVESGLAYLRTNPARAWQPILWLARGKAYVKSQLAQRCSLDVANLPFNEEVIAFVREQRTSGRKIILATASHKVYAEQIAAHLNLFDCVLATDAHVNLSAANKRERLVDEYGEGGFDYMGNSLADLDVWAAARHAIVVNPEPGVTPKANRLGKVIKIIDTQRNAVSTWFKALRGHQWLKNLLLFVPLLASHQFGRPALLLDGLLAFVSFGLCASSAYLLNDLLDLTHDRRHPSKRLRPFAAGQLSTKAGLALTPLLLILAFGLARLLPWEFSAALVSYYIVTLFYSFWLKRVIALDVVTLAMLYTVRIIAGTLAFQLSLTFWMLAFSMFMFLSLALIKRYTELLTIRDKGAEQMHGRGYYAADLPMVASLGAAAGFISVMVLALYIQEQSTMQLYHRPQVIWLACPLLLFWVTRVWMLTHRGEMHDDPVVFAMRDRVSLVVGALFGLVFWLAT